MSVAMNHWLLKRSTNADLLPDGRHAHPTDVPEIERRAYLWLGVIDIFLFTISTSLFIYRGRRTLDINAHAVLLTSIGSFTILIVNTCFLFQFVWPGYFPCFIILWCAYPGVMLWMSCTCARALRLYILSYRNIEKLKERNKVGQMTAAQLYGKGTLKNTAGDGGDEIDEKLESSPSKKRRLLSGRLATALRKWWDHEKMQLTERRLVWYTIGATFFSAIICSIIQALTKDLAIVPMMYSKCPVGVWEYFPLYALTAFYCLLLTPYIVYKIWPIKDAFGIRHDILLNNLFTFVCIAMFMVQTNKGFGSKDPFWDSFLWCALLFNMSQFTSVIIPLIKSYRQSEAFAWSSDNPTKNATKELFYRILNHPELFEKLKVYSAANFCTEITLFLEEYQVLKANVVRFYNIGEAGFDDDEEADDDGDDDGQGIDDSHPNLTTPSTTASNNGVWTSVPTRANPKGSRNIDLESNPDTIISMGDDGHSMSDIDYSDRAAMVQQQSSSPKNNQGTVALSGRLTSEIGDTAASPNINGGSSSSTPGKFGGFLRSKNNNGDKNNTATFAAGGATIGNLPIRRNSQGEDIMVLSKTPPFTPVRYTILSTLLQTPAGLERQGNLTTFKTLPFALRGDFYGFYSTFIADGATLQINVDGKISEAITRLIHSQQYTVDMMDECHTEVLQLLYDNIFKKFVRIYHRDLAALM